VIDIHKFIIVLNNNHDILIIYKQIVCFTIERPSHASMCKPRKHIVLDAGIQEIQRFKFFLDGIIL